VVWLDIPSVTDICGARVSNTHNALEVYFKSHIQTASSLYCTSEVQDMPETYVHLKLDRSLRLEVVPLLNRISEVVLVTKQY
jgi:hypothetical protein